MSWVPLTFCGPLLMAAPLARLTRGGRRRERPVGATCCPGWTYPCPMFHGAGPNLVPGDSAAMRSALLAFLLLSSPAATAQLPANFTRATPAPRRDTIP